MRNKLHVLLFFLVFILLATIVSADDFVTVNGTHFYLNGKPFYFSGTNAYFLWYGNYDCNKTIPDPNGHCVTELFDDASAMNFTVIRTWGFSDGPEYWGSLQPDAGVYSEPNFQKYDRMIKEAADHNTRLIIPLVNNWNDFGGMCQYVRWCNASVTSCSDTSAVHDRFYTDDCTRQLYKDYVAYFANRTNTLTGIKYKDDPTIFAWELANEPRAQSDGSGDMLYNWVAEMSAYIKSIDQNHLIATGEDGFYVSGDRTEYGYHGEDGADFIRNSEIPTIDFASFHVYSWSGYDNSLYWIQKHAEDARFILGKPIVAGEINAGETDATIKGWYNKLEETKVNGDVIWMLCPTNFVESGNRCVRYPGDSLIDFLINHSNYMNNRTVSSNSAPVLDFIEDITVNAGDLVTIIANATDADNDTLSYSINSCWFEQNNNTFTWQTTEYSTGTHNFRVTVNDGDLGDSQTVYVNVIGKNHSCVLLDCNTVIGKNMVLCPGTYKIINGINIPASNVTLDCNGSMLVGNGSGTGINTDKAYTTIKNCQIHNYSIGVASMYKNNGLKFLNNIVTQCGLGIYLDLNRNNTIRGNKFINAPVKLWNSDFNLFANNTLINASTGILLHKVDHSQFINNTVRNNGHGFSLIDETRLNKFENNIVDDNLKGFIFSWHVNSNLFVRNKVTNNGYGFYHRDKFFGVLYDNIFDGNEVKNNNYGMWLGASRRFNITNNLIINNTRGILLLKSDNITIYHNNFINNTVLQGTDERNNFWDYNQEGNYWSDYDELSEGCIDSDDNGICDSPYVIDLDSQDNYPFTRESGWLFKKFFLNLTQGWNLISLPIKPDNITIASVFNGLNYDYIYTYENNAYVQLNDNHEIDLIKGYWINVSDNYNLTINGTISAYPLTYNLISGYNLISYPSINEFNINYIFDNVNSSILNILTYDNINKNWQSHNYNKSNELNTITTTKPGQGYFIKLNKDINWSFNGKFS